MRNRAGFWAIIALSAYVTLCSVAGIFVAEIAYHPQRRPVPTEDVSIQRAGLSFSDNFKNVAISTSGGVILRAWLIRPNQLNGDAVILLHGLSDNRLGMSGYARLLLARGYTVLMPDARAHGSSDGSLATYGLLERYDIHDWVEWIELGERPKCIFGLGESMGQPSYYRPWRSSTGSALSQPSLPFRTFVRLLTTVSANSFTLDRGLDGQFFDLW